MSGKLRFTEISEVNGPMDELPFSKRKQLGHPKQNRIEKEAAFRNIYFAIVDLFYREVLGVQAPVDYGFCMACSAVQPRAFLQLSHIEKKAHGRKYDFDNVQLLCHHCHDLQERRIYEKDLRPRELFGFIKKYLISFGDDI